MATDRFSQAMSDSVYCARSVTLVNPSDDTYNLIAFPKMAFIKQVALFVVTKTDGTTTSLTVGWAGNGETAQAAGFISNDIADVKTVGMKWSIADTLVSNRGKWFNSGPGMVTLTFAKGDASSVYGTYIVLVDYVMIW